MWQNSWCSILFHLLVPGGKWQTSMTSPVSSARHSELVLPQAGAGGVGTAGVAGDEQPGGALVARNWPSCLPPQPDRVHRERGGLVAGADGHEPAVGRDVVDPVGQSVTVSFVPEVMVPHLHRVPRGPPGPPVPVIGAELLLLLPVDAGHGLPGRLDSAILALMCPNWASRSSCCLPSVTRDMPRRLQPSSCISRAIASFPQANPRRAICRAMPRSDSTDQVISDMGRRACPLPAARPAPLLTRAARRRPWPARAVPPGPARPQRAERPRVRGLRRPRRHRGRRRARRPRHRRDPAVAQRVRLGPQVNTPLPLVQQRPPLPRTSRRVPPRQPLKSPRSTSCHGSHAPNQTSAIKLQTRRMR